MFNFVDTSLPDLQLQVSMEAIERYDLENFAEEQIEAIKKIPTTFTLLRAISDYISSAIFGFLLSLMIAGVTRNK